MVKVKPTYFEDGRKRLYAIELATGKEIPYFKTGSIVVRGAVPSDVDDIFSTEGMKDLIKSLAFISGHSIEETTQRCKSSVGEGLQKSYSNYWEDYVEEEGVNDAEEESAGNEEDDQSSIFFIIEAKKKFVGYIEVVPYSAGVEFEGEVSFEVNPTFVGIAPYWVNSMQEQLHKKEVCNAFTFMCQKHDLYEHVDLVTVIDKGCVRVQKTLYEKNKEE